MGGPLFMAVAFGLIGVWIVLLALPGLRRPPPGCEPGICPLCAHANDREAKTCKACGAGLKS
jgi:hypothetical protein